MITNGFLLEQHLIALTTKSAALLLLKQVRIVFVLTHQMATQSTKKKQRVGYERPTVMISSSVVETLLPQKAFAT